MMLLALISGWRCSKKNPAAAEAQPRLVGHVFLDGETDHSGITVALYPLAQPDSTWDTARERFPFVGMEQAQQLIFDHREHEPIVSTRTGPDGTYELTAFEPGTYNLVATKAGWGWRYITNVALSNKNDGIGTGHLSTHDSLVLKREVLLDTNLNRTLKLERGQHCVVLEDVLIEKTGTLILGEDNWLRIAPFKTLTVEGTVLWEASDKYPGVLTVNATQQVTQLFDALKVENGANLSLKNVRISHGSSGLVLRSSDVSVEKLFLSFCNSGIIISKIQSALSKLVFMNCQTGVRADGYAGGTIEHSVFLRLTGRAVDSGNNVARIANNYFSHNLISIEFGGASRSTVVNNYFAYDSITFNLIGHEANPQVANNTVSQSAIAFRIVNDVPVSLTNSYYNNLLGVKQWFVYTEQLRHDIDLTNNYWGTTILSEIERKIWDGNDYTLSYASTGRIIYLPIHNSLFSDSIPRPDN